MGDAIGQILTSAVGIGISPVPLIAVVLMLATPRGRTNGPAFALAWFAALSIVVTVVLVATPGRSASAGRDTPAAWVLWVKLGLGILFLAMAVLEWRGRPRQGGAADEPGWMKAIDTFHAGRAAGLAALLAVANPKNLALAVGGALSISGSGTTAGGRAAAAAVMVVLGSLCTLVPLTVYFLGGDRSTRVLGGWKTWMSAHSTAIVMTGLVVLGAKYVGDAVSGLG
ncbi:GAP family protein [Streptomyces montanisoli]|uniref:GAP family protein n=1 Tax=Streptomyces montanisoli TaxID=2798581 RepID=A0A940MGB4_9ACTN|nr:GAP family protein [Streptomyces montanisoli]MBP0458671.1 GAP family protein [Streptomyces montanisoli]